MKLVRALPALFVVLAAHAADAPAQQFSRFAGRVLNALTGEPSRKAKLTLRSTTSADISYRLATDEQGGFSHPTVAAGNYDLVVQRPGNAQRCSFCHIGSARFDCNLPRASLRER